MIACNFNNFDKTLIEDNNNRIKSFIDEKLQKEFKGNINIVIKNKCYIDNILITSYSINNGMTGYAILQNEKDDIYIIKTFNYGFNIVDYPIITTATGKYLVVIGKEYNTKVQSLRIELENNKFDFEINNEQYFIKYCNVPKNLKSSYGESYVFLDENKNNITGIVKHLQNDF